MKDNIIYKREIKFHTAENTPTFYTLEISTRNKYVEFTMCGEHGQNDFNPKDGPQTELHKLWDDWHIKKYCELDDEDKTEELKYLCDNICNAIEKEEEEYLESLNVKTEEDIDDDRIIALMKHLDITPEEAYYDIAEAKYGNNYYTYGNKEYQVLTDSEADDEERGYVEQLIEDCYLSDLTRNNKNHPVLQFIDMDAWLDSWCGNRGENLSSWDGCEHDEEVNGTTYYIYRKN